VKGLLVEDARARILELAAPMPAETAALSRALGRVLAEPVAATRDQPPFDASAMDGWAVRSADGGEARRIVGESAAGHGYEAGLNAGEAVRIFTGAPVPRGADAVLIQENASREGETLRTEAPPAAGANIRRAGGDFRAGAALLEAGVRLDPWRLSLAAAAGRAELRVARRPRVAILSTGEEIVAPGAAPGPWQIFNSGGPALSALVAAWGAEIVPLPPVGDSEDAIAEAVADAACDVVATIGGASVGDHDLVKPALARLGLSLAVDSLKMRPGKPMWFGVLADGRRVLGLPGNPASAMVCAELFLRPLLAAMQGADASVPIVRARLVEPLPANGPREHWMRARTTVEDGVLVAAPLRDQDSSLVTIFAAADALLRRPIEAAPAKAGDLVDILPLPRAR
jgi:molybdopterin molybdotransferase